MSKVLSILCLYGNTIIKVFISLFLLGRIGNILAIFKIYQEVLLSIEFCHFTLKWNCYFSACKWKCLESTSQFSFSLQCHQTYFLYTFFSSNITYFGQKQPVKVQIFEIFKCSGQNLSNSSCQFWTDKSIPLQIWYHSSLSWHKTPL